MCATFGYASAVHDYYLVGVGHAGEAVRYCEPGFSARQTAQGELPEGVVFGVG